MATFIVNKAGKTSKDLGRVLNYVSNPEKTEEKYKTSDSEKCIYNTGINCSDNPRETFEQFMDTKAYFDKEKDNKNSGMYKHFVQSFKPQETNPKQAHEIGLKLANKLYGEKGFECYISTHIDKEHIHNHIVVNSVNFETGNTLRFVGNKDLEICKHYNDEICKEYGLSVINRAKLNKENTRTYNKAEYMALKKPETSWKVKIKDAVIQAREVASRSKEFSAFENELKKQGIKVEYNRSQREFTYQLEGTNKKVRASNLAKTFGDKSLYREEIEKTIAKPVEVKTISKHTPKQETFYNKVNNISKAIDNSLRTSSNGKEFMENLKKNNVEIVKMKTGFAYRDLTAIEKKPIYDTTIAKIKHSNRFLKSGVEMSLATKKYIEQMHQNTSQAIKNNKPIQTITQEQKQSLEAKPERYNNNRQTYREIKQDLLKIKSEIVGQKKNLLNQYEKLNVKTNDEIRKEAVSTCLGNTTVEYQAKKANFETNLKQARNDLIKSMDRLDKHLENERPSGIIATMQGKGKEYDQQTEQLTGEKISHENKLQNLEGQIKKLDTDYSQVLEKNNTKILIEMKKIEKSTDNDKAVSVKKEVQGLDKKINACNKAIKNLDQRHEQDLKTFKKVYKMPSQKAEITAEKVTYSPPKTPGQNQNNMLRNAESLIATATASEKGATALDMHVPEDMPELSDNLTNEQKAQIIAEREARMER